MKWLKYVFLSVGMSAGLTPLMAQSDEYLDDAYLSRTDIEKREAKARHDAEVKRKAMEAERKLWEERIAKERAELLKRQRSREIDAYNGILSREDSLRIEAEAHLYARSYGNTLESEGGYQGEYARRLSRFYGDGSTVIINHYYPSDFDYSYWGRSYAWHAPYWSYSPWGYRHYSYYDLFYDPWDYRYRYYRSSWSFGFGGYYGGFYGPYWGGYISYYPSYSPYWGGSVYRGNSYHGASRSSYNTARSSYEAYENSRRYYGNGSNSSYPNYNTGYHRSGSTYEGRGRSIYDSNRSSSGSYLSSSSDSYRSSSSSSSSSSSPRSSYGGGVSRSRR